MARAVTNHKISVLRDEYIRLKKLDARFGQFLAYLRNVEDIREAREEVKQKKVISQKELFERLGL